MQVDRYRYTGTSTQIQVDRHRRTDTGGQTQVDRYRCTGTSTQIQAHRHREGSHAVFSACFLTTASWALRFRRHQVLARAFTSGARLEPSRQFQSLYSNAKEQGCKSKSQ